MLWFKDDKENYYAYEITMGDHTQTGLVCCCAIDDYFNNNIKKHELTRPDKEEDRKNHVRYSKMNYEPVFFSYPHVDAVTEVVNRSKNAAPLHDLTTSDGIIHRLWAIDDDADINRITQLFEEQVSEHLYC